MPRRYGGRHGGGSDAKMASNPTLDGCLARWSLSPDGTPLTTHTSILLPVRQAGMPVMLKLATEAEERRGGESMIWWGGDGAARVLAHAGDALLMERAMGERSLVEMAQNDRDDEASRIICAVASRLHAPRDRRPPPSLVPLTQWFAELEPAATRHGGLLSLAAVTARELLDQPQDVVVLHGDLHHGNVLDFGPRGWLAIDPKHLVGERTFDFVNVLRNPDAGIALRPRRFARQVTVVADAAGLDRTRLLRWILAFTGLSAAWILGDGDQPELDLAVAELAAAELAGVSGC